MSQIFTTTKVVIGLFIAICQPTFAQSFQTEDQRNLFQNTMIAPTEVNLGVVQNQCRLLGRSNQISAPTAAGNVMTILFRDGKELNLIPLEIKPIKIKNDYCGFRPTSLCPYNFHFYNLHTKKYESRVVYKKVHIFNQSIVWESPNREQFDVERVTTVRQTLNFKDTSCNEMAFNEIAVSRLCRYKQDTCRASNCKGAFISNAFPNLKFKIWDYEKEANPMEHARRLCETASKNQSTTTPTNRQVQPTIPSSAQ